ncbi:PREDICTED: mediator of RNA polymerase II transcription subunit 22, partial [Bison bison bison]|uniref:Mediator of RNA polymerase II transcription subunit 22 n=1 Tax=Bison bison bison TaxID=43346 RepID=A0A6P3I1N5_BISBB
MAQQRALPQSKETLLQSYNKRLKDDVKSIMDNFTEIIKTAKIEDETQVSRATQGEQDNYEMHVRAANIVRAGESLMKLVSDLKQFLILNDFPSVNEAIDQRRGCGYRHLIERSSEGGEVLCPVVCELGSA